MSVKITQSFKTDLEGVYVYLYRDAQWQEWQVCYHKKSDARHVPETIYFTSDKSDALDHATYLSQNAQKYLRADGYQPSHKPSTATYHAQLA